MPAPQKAQLAELAKTFFRTNNKKLPEAWSQPGDQYPDAFKEPEKTVAPAPPDNLLRESSLNKYHVDAAKDIGGKLAKYIDGVAGAICGAIDKWQKMAMFTTAIITGPAGTVPPGSLQGPPLTPLVLAGAPMTTPMEIKYSMAIANAFGTAWQTWQLGVTGMLMYPAFAAFPGPMAPPTPNVPVPLITFASAGEAMLSPSTLKGLMIANLADPLAKHAPELFDAIAQAFGVVFLTYKSSTMVMNVLGMGPIPTFAPPFVPVGPVVGGTVIPKPGVLT
jgi:hypothetical protein